MSRIANSPVIVPACVEVLFDGTEIFIKGNMGMLSHNLHPDVEVIQAGSTLKVSATNKSKKSVALAGTARAILNNMVIGVSQYFEKKLSLVGVGYRAKTHGNVLDLILGFSHPVQYKIPDGIKIATPSQTEIIVSGADKQAVGQSAADIRAYRPPEPYKGKGIRYIDENIFCKDAKKK